MIAMRPSSATTLLLIRPQGSRRTYRERVNAHVPLEELLERFLLKRFRVVPRYFFAAGMTDAEPLNLARTPAELGLQSRDQIMLHWATSMRDEATVQIEKSVLARTARHLRKAAMYGVEGICYWAAEWQGNYWNVTTVVRPKPIMATAMRVDVSAEENMRIETELPSDTTIIAQVHSHLGPAFHSDEDERYPFSLEPGFLSIVVPYGASRYGASSLGEGPVDFRVFELEAYPRWREWTDDEIRRRIVVTETIAARVSSRTYLARSRHKVATS